MLAARMTRASIAAAGAALCLAASALAAPVLVSSPRELMVMAIDAPDGRASGVLAGEAAAAMSARFGPSPVHVDIKTLARYAQAGCRRLSVTFWQDGVTLPGAAAPGRETVEFGINYCRDGRPPASLRQEGAK